LAFGSKPTRFFDELGPWLLLANALNIVWTVAWLGEWTGTSVAILAAINLCFVMALRRTRVGRAKAPVRVVVLEWLPLGVYAGWVAVAVIANLSAWLAKEGWVPGNSSAWALAMIALAFAYNVFVLFRRNLRDHASVAVWAFVAIAVRQWGNGELVAWGAAAAAVTLTLCIAVHLVRALAPRAVAVAR
ncbi:MAG: tryptophan-rich sensory protein, partial [Myxococcota bacterium]